MCADVALQVSHVGALMKLAKNTAAAAGIAHAAVSIFKRRAL